MAEKENKEKGSFVEKGKEETSPSPIDNTVIMSKLLNAVECIAKVLSGMGTVLVTVKTSIDANTEAFVKAREELNSLVTMLALGKTIEPKNTTPKVPVPTPIPSQPAEQKTEAPKPTTKESEADAKVSEIRMTFPTELEDMLSFTDKDDYVMIKPKQFLGSENFAKIASAVRGMGGEYISAGRDSHFRVFKKNGK